MRARECASVTVCIRVWMCVSELMSDILSSQAGSCRFRIFYVSSMRLCAGSLYLVQAMRRLARAASARLEPIRQGQVSHAVEILRGVCLMAH